MHSMRLRRSATLALAACALAGLAGCRIHEEKAASGEDKNVQIDTPIGGLHVNNDQTTAKDLGLPLYPGAQLVKGDDKHNSTDVNMGFGDWKLRIRTVSYDSPDSQDKILDFYKKALGSANNVITCKGTTTLGKPVATSEGLTCNSDKKIKVEVKGQSGDKSADEIQLKAGSNHHQRIVAIEESAHGRTRYSISSLDLPQMIKTQEKAD